MMELYGVANPCCYCYGTKHFVPKPRPEVEDDRTLDGDQGNDDGTVDEPEVEKQDRCAMCGRFLKPGEGCPTHDPHYKEEVEKPSGDLEHELAVKR